jgi:hypothetical protein
MRGPFGDRSSRRREGHGASSDVWLRGAHVDAQARLAQGYAAGREAGGDMVRQARRDLGIDPPAEAAALVSVIIALCDGLMLQWLVDPDATPDGRKPSRRWPSWRLS